MDSRLCAVAGNKRETERERERVEISRLISVVCVHSLGRGLALD